MAVGGIEAERVVLLLTDEGRHGGALDKHFHLGLNGEQAAADDLERHRIDGIRQKAGAARLGHAFGSRCGVARVYSKILYRPTSPCRCGWAEGAERC